MVYILFGVSIDDGTDATAGMLVFSGYFSQYTYIHNNLCGGKFRLTIKIRFGSIFFILSVGFFRFLL